MIHHCRGRCRKGKGSCDEPVEAVNRLGGKEGQRAAFVPASGTVGRMSDHCTRGSPAEEEGRVRAGDRVRTDELVVGSRK